MNATAGGTAPPDDLAADVHRGGVAGAAPERAEVDDPARRGPRERSEATGGGAISDDLAAGPAKLSVPPSVPMSTIPPVGVHEKAWYSAFPARLLCPTTWPLGLTAASSLPVPPSVPRSVVPHARLHVKAWKAPPTRVLPPTTSPLAFTAEALLKVSPSVPRSTIPPDRVHEKAWN